MTHKDLTKEAVLEAAQTFLETADITSTLVIKTALRAAGYWALQREVSLLMAELAGEGALAYVNYPGHRTYYDPKATDTCPCGSDDIVALCTDVDCVSVTDATTGKVYLDNIKNHVVWLAEWDTDAMMIMDLTMSNDPAYVIGNRTEAIQAYADNYDLDVSQIAAVNHPKAK
jgi:hypothetical protein